MTPKKKNTSKKGRSIPERAELHTHLGSSVDPPILWALAHEQGIRLPSKNYWDFEDMITLRGDEKNASLDDMHNNFFHWTELIQSSPIAVERAVKEVIGGGYRKCNLVVHELRFNPMFRNNGGKQDLDHIIMAALRGMDKATLEYPQVRAGLILMMDRSLPKEKNAVIVDKAIRYKSRGIVGIDIGGPQRGNFSMKSHHDLFMRARDAGLGLTVHTGEEGKIDELRYVVENIKPERIGHGLLAAQDKDLMQSIAREGIVLETCPTSNIKNSCVKDIAALKKIITAFKKNGVKFTINTDGPEMYGSNIYKEEQLLLDHKVITEEELITCRQNAFDACFV